MMTQKKLEAASMRMCRVLAVAACALAGIVTGIEALAMAGPDAGRQRHSEEMKISGGDALRGGVKRMSGEYALLQEFRIHAVGGGVRGAGILARYGDPGPERVYVRRVTQIPADEPYAPIALVRAFDPRGNLVALHEFTDQESAAEAVTLRVPAGHAGIWRVSVSGGREGDRFEVGMPEANFWGVRGEMSLAVTEATPSPAYLYLPASVETVMMEQFGSGNAALRNLEGELLGRPQSKAKKGGRRLLVLEAPPAGQVLKVELPRPGAGSVLFDGVPGLLCPTVDAARELKGGVVEAGGLLTAGPLQARARRWMLEQSAKDLRVNVELPAHLPADLQNPVAEAQIFGKYGLVSGLTGFLEEGQNTDASDPYYGSTYHSAEHDRPRPSWDSYQYGGVLAPFTAEKLAAAVRTETRLNPYAGNDAMMRRAALAGFYHFASLQGDDLLREGRLWQKSGCYPMIHGFFVYQGALAKPYFLLYEKLPPEAAEIWKQGVMAVGDKLADYQAYQSNQWAHVILGHLYTYKATGAIRFHGYFKRLLKAYLDGAFGPDAKFGQHPAGFFLEQYGADGNYDNMNLTAVATMYYEYRETPSADAALLADLRESIQKNLEFKRFHWLTDAAGGGFSATAFNSRRSGSSLFASNPRGDYMAHRDVDLALARVRMTPMPEQGTFPASVFPYMAVTPEWGGRLIRESLPRLGTDSYNNWLGGKGMPEMARRYREPGSAAVVTLPIHADRGTWRLPGQLAWKRGALYGLLFFDVAGAAPGRKLLGFMGGGPTALWTPGTGCVLASMAPGRDPGSHQEDALTFSSVAGVLKDGSFFHTGKERANLVELEKDRIFEIRSRLSHPEGELTWRYGIRDDSIRVSVHIDAPAVGEAFLNLPVLVQDQNRIDRVSDTEVRVDSGAGNLTFKVASGGPVQLTEPLPTSQRSRPVRCVRVPLHSGTRTCRVRLSAAASPAGTPGAR